MFLLVCLIRNYFSTIQADAKRWDHHTPAVNDVIWKDWCATEEALKYADMPKGFPKVKEMVDALLADPLATFATSAYCTKHKQICPIHGAADACMYGHYYGGDGRSRCGSNQAVRQSM